MSLGPPHERDGEKGGGVSEIKVLFSLLLLAAVIAGSVIWAYFVTLRQVEKERRALAAKDELLHDRQAP